MVEQIKDRIGEWSWQELFSAWKARARWFDAQLPTSFKVVYLSSRNFGKEYEFFWWPADTIDELRSEEEVRTTVSRFSFCYGSEIGPRETLKTLWENKGNLEKECAALIEASLYPRIKSSRAHYPDGDWPPRDQVIRLYDCVQQILGIRPYMERHNFFTYMLPFRALLDTPADDMNSLIHNLADEHVAVFLNYQPVLIVYGNKRNTPLPQFKSYSNEEFRKMRTRELYPVQENKVPVRTTVPPAKIAPPRWFDNITREDLERLVWSKPTIELAKDFGVSNVAIAKRCKKLGVIKPEPGFWAKVNAGIIPHPQGRPVNGGS